MVRNHVKICKNFVTVENWSIHFSPFNLSFWITYSIAFPTKPVPPVTNIISNLSPVDIWNKNIKINLQHISRNKLLKKNHKVILNFGWKALVLVVIITLIRMYALIYFYLWLLTNSINIFGITNNTRIYHRATLCVNYEYLLFDYL